MIIAAVSVFDAFFDGLKAPLQTYIKLGFLVYNRFLAKGLDFLLTSPDLWMGGKGWDAVKTFENTFVILASSLATVLWLISYVTEMTDIKSQVTLESEIKLFAKILLTDTFIVGAFTMVQGLFSLVDDLLGGAGVKQMALNYPEKLGESLDGLSTVNSLLLIPIGILFFIVMAICGAMICYMVFMRFFSILAAVPYAVLANATIAGNREISRTAYVYWKNMIASILSAITMIIGLKLSNSLLSSGVVSLINAKDVGMKYILVYMVQTLLFVLLTAGFIKKADDLTHRWIGG